MSDDNVAPDDEECRSSSDVPDAWLAEGFGRGSTEGPTSAFWVALESMGVDAPSVALKPIAAAAEERVEASAVPAAAHVASQTTEDGRYKIFGELARGGMGVVMHGHDVDLGRDVAVKILRKRHTDDAKLVQRFVEEAQIGGQLQHPGIAPVYTLGLLAGDRPYFSMKLIKGCTLSELLRQRTSPKDDYTRFLRIFEQVCQTVAFAHTRRVLHRDLKPANIMVGAFGEVLVMDWGLAKVLAAGGVADERRSRVAAANTIIETVRTESPDFESQSGSVMGTFAYMAPEQARGEVETLTTTADVFSLGAILCQILTGKPPYVGDTSALIYHQAFSANLDPAFERLAACSAAGVLVELVRRCLSIDPVARPRDAGIVAGEISGYLRQREERARAATVEAAKAQAKAREAARRVVQERRARRLGIALGAAVVLIVGGAVAAWMHLDARARERQRHTTSLAVAAVEEANRLFGHARSQDPPSPAAWDRALSAATRAQELAANEDVRESTRASALGLATQLTTEAGAARTALAIVERDRAVVDELEETRLQFGEDWEWDRQADSYADIFRRIGIDVLSLPADDVIRAVEQSAIAADLVGALDDWATALKGVSNKTRDTASLSRKLHRVTRTADPDTWRNEVRKAYHKSDTERIKELVKQRQPRALSAHVAAWIGDVLGYEGQATDAVAWLKRASVAHPKSFWINHQLAKFATNLSPADNELAIRHYSAALALRPKSVGAWDNLGLALKSEQRIDEAIDAFERAIRFDPEDPIAYANLAGVFIDAKGEYDRGLEWLDKALSVKPSYATAAFCQANAYAGKGETDKAIAAFKRSLAMKPRDKIQAHAYLRDVWRHAVNNLGTTYLYLKDDPEEAKKCYETTLRVFPKDASQHYNIGIVMEKEGKLDEAMKSYRTAVRHDPSHSSAWTNIGHLLDRQGKPDEAETHYRKAIAVDPQNGVALSNLGNILRRDGKLDESEALLRRSTMVPRKHASEFFDSQHWRDDAWYNLGLLHLQHRRRPHKAETCFRKAIELNAEHWDAILDLGNALAAQGKGNQAIRCWRRLDGKPTDAKALYNLGNTYVAMNRWDDALAAYEKSAAVNENDARTWGQLAYVHLRRGRNEKGRECSLRAIAADPSYDIGHMNLGSSWYGQKEYERAIVVFERALNVARLPRPQRARIRQFLGECHEQLGLYDKARAHMQAARLLNRTDSRVIYRLGMLHDTIGDRAAALALFQQAVTLNPTDIDAQVDIGSVLESLGRFDEAARAYERGVELAKKDPHWGHDAARWVRDARRMSEIANDVDSYLTGAREAKDADDKLLLARTCMAIGRPAAAAEIFEAVLAANPKIHDGAHGGNWWMRSAECAAKVVAGDTAETGIDDASLARMRRKVIEYLRRDMATYDANVSTASRGALYDLLKQLRLYKLHKRFAIVRDEKPLQAAPAEDRAVCIRFWERVDELMARVLTRLEETAPREAASGKAKR